MKYSYMLILIILAACSPKPEMDGEAKNTPTNPETDITAVLGENEANSQKQLSDCNLVLGFDAWEPYQYADVGGRVAGLDIELVSGVAQAIGCKITYEQGTWVDLLNALKQGDIDILLGASKTPSREEFAFFSEPYRTEEFSLYIRKDDEQSASYSSLTEFIENGSKIGIVADYLYGDEVARLLDDPEKSTQFVNAIMGEMNIARLLDGDIDGFLEDSFVGASLLRRKALSEYIVAHGITIETGNAYVMFSQQSITPEQLDLFNKQLLETKESQTYQDLLAKYSY